MFRAAWQDGKDIEPEVGLDFCPSPSLKTKTKP